MGVAQLEGRTYLQEEELTRDEIVSRIEEQTKARFGLSAADFIREYRAGRLKDPIEATDVMTLVAILAEEDVQNVLAA